jgi:Asp-tRNA(Asn)/Glu-tRNA(Gln) amidotransferase A subunit family amidase
LVVALSVLVPSAREQAPPSTLLNEITISALHVALRNRTLTCRAIVQEYVRRIEAFDKRGPAVNSIVQVNDAAMRIADDLDQRAGRSGLVGPMHCVPVIVKDNYETIDLPTTAGSLSLAGMMTGKDAFVVKRLREAGAVILAKANMHEFAFSQYETVSSILPGYTRNPYDLSRVTAGSSGGTAAAVAANLGAVGLGTDTGASIRGPAAHQALVGLRPTMGLTSRAGVVPVFLDSDVTGPLTRTVADTAAVLSVIAGYDPADAATEGSRGRVPATYTTSLVVDGLKSARIGVLRQAFESTTNDTEVMRLFQTALADLRRAGAELLDPAVIDRLDELRRPQGGMARCNAFKHDLNQYLAGLGDKAPKRSLEEIVKSRQFHPTIQARLETSQSANDVPGETDGCRDRLRSRAAVREAVVKMLDENRLDAVVYPTWSNPPRLIGDLNTPHGDNNQLFAPSTGFPAITVPMGYTRGNTLPAGLQFFGRAWSEPTLLKLAYAYEQATHHRRAPSSTPPLSNSKHPAP